MCALCLWMCMHVCALTCVYVCIYILMCIHVRKYRHTCTVMHVLRSENNLGYWSPLCTLFDRLLSTAVHTKLASSQAFECPLSASHLLTKELRLLHEPLHPAPGGGLGTHTQVLMPAGEAFHPLVISPAQGSCPDLQLLHKCLHGGTIVG